MSDRITPIVCCERTIMAQESSFNEISKLHNEVQFKKEAFFAMEILRKSNFMQAVATRKPESLRAAIVNVATIGLSLNPALKRAYLVPRGGEILLDVSYMGLIQLATDTGSIRWAQAEIVYKKDTYESNGVGLMPNHVKDPFSKDRGEITGAYAVAKTCEGDFLTTEMAIDEIYNIRNRSEAYKKKSGPWVTDEKEMIKKTVLRRAVKLWPKSEKTERLNHAVEAMNRVEGINFERDVTPPDSLELGELNSLIEKTTNGLERLLNYCSRYYKRDVKSVEDLNKDEVLHCINLMKGMGEK